MLTRQTFSIAEAAHLLGFSGTALSDMLDAGKLPNVVQLRAPVGHDATRRQYGRRVVTQASVYKHGGYAEQLAAPVRISLERTILTMADAGLLLNVSDQIAERMLTHEGCPLERVGNRVYVLADQLEKALEHPLCIWPAMPETKHHRKTNGKARAQTLAQTTALEARVAELEHRLTQVCAGTVAMVGDHDDEIYALWEWAKTQGFDMAVWGKVGRAVRGLT